MFLKLPESCLYTANTLVYRLEKIKKLTGLGPAGIRPCHYLQDRIDGQEVPLCESGEVLMNKDGVRA